jgi:hypothetical protein
MEDKMNETIDCNLLFGCKHSLVDSEIKGVIKKIGRNITLQCTESCISEGKDTFVCCFLCSPMCSAMCTSMDGQSNIDLARLKVISLIAKYRENGK